MVSEPLTTTPVSPSPVAPVSHETAPLPVLREELHVGTEQVEVGAVRVRIEVDRSEVPLSLEEVRDEWQVERVAVDREVDAVREPWTEGDTLVVPVYRRVPVVHERLVLAEEVRLVRRRVISPETARVSVRHERAVVERRRGDGAWQAIDTTSSAARDESPTGAGAGFEPSIHRGDSA